MKEIPILFSTAMVKAILEGRKIQTRRIMKPQIKDCDHSRHVEVDWKDKPIQWSEAALKIGRAYYGCCGNGVEYSNDFSGIKCPYGKPGDILWVRETYKIEGSMNHGESVLGVTYKAGGRWIQNDSKEVFEIFHKSKEGWRPNIFLPKEAARIWLQVESVRVERLKNITDKDAIAEGIESYVVLDDLIAYKNYSELARKDFLNKSSYGFDSGKETHSAPVASFCSLWVEINGRECWISNPWVWVVSFKVLSTTGKPDLKLIQKQ